MSDLSVFSSMVQSPFFILTVGEYTFGSVSKSFNGGSYNVDFPNFIQSLNVVKINGEVNTYTINLSYQIRNGDDPNMLDKVFSTISDRPLISLLYGDWMEPGYIYRESEATITSITSSLSFESAKISYVIKAVGAAVYADTTKYFFPAYSTPVKPSDVIAEKLRDNRLGLNTVFTGMASITDTTLNQLIASNDKPVILEAQPNMTSLDYIRYLVGCMQPIDSSKKSAYYLSIIDDYPNNEFGGPYFKVTEVDKSGSNADELSTVVIDVGYPDNHFVSNFSVKTSDEWSRYFNYSQNVVSANNYRCKIDNHGNRIVSESPSITRDVNTFKSTAESDAWWNKMTEYPITADITIRGLLRASMIMQYVKINCVFYGQRYLASGLYVVTRQEDSISSNGYKTTLSLLRVKGDSQSLAQYEGNQQRDSNILNHSQGEFNFSHENVHGSFNNGHSTGSFNLGGRGGN